MYLQVRRITGLFIIMTAALILSTGCTSYPDCGDDDDCQSDGRTEYCFNAKCNQCREDAHCGDSPCARCRDGACGKMIGCCETNTDCPQTRPRCNNNLCDVMCKSDQDCAADARCQKFQCITLECTADKPCKLGNECKNGSCVKIPLCELQPITFAKAKSALSRQAKAILKSNATCYQEIAAKLGPVNIILVGHANDGKKPDAHLKLSQQRADLIKKEWARLGVPLEQLATDAKGDSALPEADAQHPNNRSVLFTIQGM